jgi:hypothetical protein
LVKQRKGVIYGVFFAVLLGLMVVYKTNFEVIKTGWVTVCSYVLRIDIDDKMQSLKCKLLDLY